MSIFRTKMNKRKRILFSVAACFVVLAIAGTIAYNQDSMFFANLFKLGDDITEFVETFESPDNWSPCTETPKTAIATNKNTTLRYVRMKITEYWRTKDSAIPEDDHETTDLPLTWTDGGAEKHYAVINTQNGDSWEQKSDGWYYYDHALAQNESTLSLLKSVTFNCEVNTAGEVRYGVDGQTAESVPSDYAGAKYHLYITFQMSEQEFVAERETLYDIVAKQTRGLDTALTYLRNDISNSSNIGVYTAESFADSRYPVYYYYGNSSKNHIVWRGSCWRILRTTDTGGVKLLYNGEEWSTSSRCNNQVASGNRQPGITVGSQNGFHFSDNVSAYATAYKYGKSYALGTIEFPSSPVMVDTNAGTVSAPLGTLEYEPSNARYREYGNDVEWRNGEYHLVNTVHGTSREDGDIYNGRINLRNKITANHHYYCENDDTKCETVLYFYNAKTTSSGDDSFSYIRLTDGDKIEDVAAKALLPTNDSIAKQRVDEWFEEKYASYVDDLEDTVFCNDHVFASKNALTGKDDAFGSIMYRSRKKYVNVSDGAFKPSLSCLKRDSYTVKASNGNGALKYPVGLATLEEIIMSGGYYFQNWSSYGNADVWTMSPSSFSTSMGTAKLHDSGYGTVNTKNYVIRPVISLKHATYVTDETSGDDYGSYYLPYELDY